MREEEQMDNPPSTTGAVHCTEICDENALYIYVNVLKAQS